MKQNKEQNTHGMISKSGMGLLLGLISIVVNHGVVGEASTDSTWKAQQIVTTIAFNQALLADLGIDVGELQPTAAPVAQHPLSVSSPDSPAFAANPQDILYFVAPGLVFEDFTGGVIKHRGGFELQWSGGSASLLDFMLGPGPEPRTLEIMNSVGDVLFIGDHLHYEIDVDRRTMQIFNVDLRVSQRLARQIGRERLAGDAVGVLTVTAVVDMPPDLIPEGTCPPNWVGDVDVALIDMAPVGQAARAGGQVVMVPSARLKNVGTADVPWYSKFSGNFPPYDNDQHPFLVWAAYRIAGGVMQQLAVSDAKHAFLTINQNCEGCGADSHILGLGCEDVYGQGTNTSNNSLAWREEISASTGIWAHCDEPLPNTISHFDQDGDCIQDFSGAGEDTFTHGAVVDEADLQISGADYYFQAWYVVRDDIDIYNTMGYRQFDPVLDGGAWDFTWITTLVNGSPVDAWIDPQNPGPGELNRSLATPEGHLQLAVKTIDLGGGQHRYDYGLMNHDFDRRIRSFSLPLLPGTNVSNIGFSDIDNDGGNDWQATVTEDSIIWEAPTGGDALDWGKMYNFSFEADIAPNMSEATLVPEEPGNTTEERISTLAAGPFLGIFTDGFESGDTSAWSLVVL